MFFQWNSPPAHSPLCGFGVLVCRCCYYFDFARTLPTPKRTQIPPVWRIYCDGCIEETYWLKSDVMDMWKLKVGGNSNIAFEFYTYFALFGFIYRQWIAPSFFRCCFAFCPFFAIVITIIDCRSRCEHCIYSFMFTFCHVRVPSSGL